MIPMVADSFPKTLKYPTLLALGLTSRSVRLD